MEIERDEPALWAGIKSVWNYCRVPLLCVSSFFKRFVRAAQFDCLQQANNIEPVRKPYIYAFSY